MGISARIRENPTVPGDLQVLGLLRRAQQDSCALVDHIVGIHQLGVGPADHPVVRTGLPDLFGAQRLPAPGMRIVLRHRAELCPQLADPAPVVRHRLRVGHPQRLLEERVDERRPIQVDPVFPRPRHRDLLLSAGRDRDRLILTGPIRTNSPRPQSHPGSPGLRAGDQNHRRPAGLDIDAGLVEQRLRRIAADTAVPGRRSRRVDPLRQQQTRIPVAPGQQVDHPDRIHRRQDPGVSGLPRRCRHQVDRFGGRGFVALIDLTGTDEYRGPWIQTHHGSVRLLLTRVKT